MSNPIVDAVREDVLAKLRAMPSDTKIGYREDSRLAHDVASGLLIKMLKVLGEREVADAYEDAAIELCFD